jgi:hypothetical protein
LFYKPYQSDNQFKFVSGTKGQVWSLFVHDGTLFCGHDSGTFIIRDDQAQNIFSASGTWKFEPMPNNRDIIFQGNYFGISVLKRINNQWLYQNKLEGFDYSSKYFEVTPAAECFISHEYKGVFRFRLDKSLKKALNIVAYSKPVKGKNASLTQYNNVIYYLGKNPLTFAQHFRHLGDVFFRY